jgi:hypothetical protein
MLQDNSVMHYLRYNIASALGAILFVAVGFAALREADELWDNWLFSLTLGLLLFAVLLAAYRTGERRAFWIGFALFGWGYLSLSLIPSTEPRLITTKALSYLHHQSTIFGIRVHGVRVIPDLDRMRAYNVSLDDLLMATEESRMLGTREQEEFRRKMRTIEYVRDVRGSYVLGFVHPRYNEPKQWEDIILKANAEGELLRLKDVAKVERGSSFYAPHWAFAPHWARIAEPFIHIGHTLFALLAAWLGGVLFGRLRSVSVTPEVPTEGESRKRTSVLP